MTHQDIIALICVVITVYGMSTFWKHMRESKEKK
jgi:hypothetical protein